MSMEVISISDETGVQSRRVIVDGMTRLVSGFFNIS